MILRPLFLFTISLICINPVQAEVYRWVDEKGVTHFGDKPPSATKKQTEASQVNLRSKRFYEHVKPLTPIKYQGDDKPQLIIFEELILKLAGAKGNKQTIGTRTVSKGSTCGSPQTVNWNDDKLRISENKMMGDIVVAFKDEGYRMTVGNIVKVSSAASRLVLKASISRIRLEVCDQPRKSSSKQHQKAAVYIHINWKLADRLTRKVVYDGSSEGVFNAFDQFRVDGGSKAVNQALNMAAKNLLADKLFINKLQPKLESGN